MKNKFSPVILSVGLVVFGLLFVVASNSSLFRKSAATSSDGTVYQSLDASITRDEAIVASSPTVTKPYIDLAALYLQKVRETSDSSYYAKIDALMDSAAAIDPKNGDIPAIRASTAMGRHDFKAGNIFATQAIALNPTRPAYFGLQGDAYIELGRYADAVAAFQKMIDIRPDFNSWSRIAYIRELYGDIPAARDALKQAIASGSNYPENIAWAHVELGKLDLRTDPEVARKDFNDALGVLPTYTQAMEGLGKVEYAEGNSAQAEKQFISAYNGLALAQYAIDLGDLYDTQNNSTKASQYYALAQNAFSTSIKAGVNTDLEESLFLSDHRLDMENAIIMATRAYTDRPSIYGADYLAWALYQNSQPTQATSYTGEALRLGENDPLIMFHQGMIALKNGDTVRAKAYLQKAYDLNPNFSIQYAKLLKTTLASLK